MIPVYVAVWGRFGQKFAAGVGISLFTGFACYLAVVLLQPQELERDFSQIPFCWQLFVFFPLFCPLALPLWLIPVILLLSYLIAVSGFGGYGRHFFNPIAFAVVFMICGYSTTAVMNVSRPLPAADVGYKVWTAGMPPAKATFRIFREIPLDEVFSASVSGLLPSIPGSAYPGVLLILGICASIIARRRIVWLISLLTVMATLVLLARHQQLMEFSILHPMLLGLFPSLVLVAIVDYTSIPEPYPEQFIDAALFAVLVLLFFVRVESQIAMAFALLLARVASPLLCDICFFWRAR